MSESPDRTQAFREGQLAAVDSATSAWNPVAEVFGDCVAAPPTRRRFRDRFRGLHADSQVAGRSQGAFLAVIQAATAEAYARGFVHGQQEGTGLGANEVIHATNSLIPLFIQTAIGDEGLPAEVVAYVRSVGLPGQAGGAEAMK